MIKKSMWHTQKASDIVEILNTNIKTGLTNKQAEALLVKNGLNHLPKGDSFSYTKAVLKQLINPLAIVLLLAGIATLFLQEYVDAAVITVALMINIIIGVIQEGRAAHIFESLENAQDTQTTVIRDGKKHKIPASELVVGDIVSIESGFAIPADIRLIKQNDLRINESALTGEWMPVKKSSKSLNVKTPITAQENMLWKSTVVITGSGVGVVVATGPNAKIGSIAQDTQGALEHKTPLQKSTENLAQTLMILVGVTIVAIIILGISRAQNITEIILLAIAVAVSAMPEGLPAAVTIVLALGMETILKKGGLVKNLISAETLGSTTIILTDKTGTLTHGVMLMSGLYSYDSIKNKDNRITEDDNKRILEMAVLASDAYIETKDGKKVVEGRPLEKAIVEAGIANDIFQDELFKSGNERIDFARFDAARRYGASLNTHKDGFNYVYITGSPEHILVRSSHYLKDGKSEKISKNILKEFKKTQDALSAEGMRFTAVAYEQIKEKSILERILAPEGEKEFVFAGLLAFEDGIREDVPAAILDAQNAGVRVIMATGDHSETARSVAARVGIAKKIEEVYTGDQIEDFSDEKLLEILYTNSVFARVLPKQKMRIAKLLQSKGEVIAMTGDGINDAPALAAADIGIAVGSGTDVAKNAADIILLKDSFAIITLAISEGRRIVDNIKKIVAYLLSTSFSEIILILGTLAMGAPLPILPVQILWANILEEGFMSFPFAFEPREKNTLKRKPNKKDATILSLQMKKFLAAVSIAVGIMLLAMFVFFQNKGYSIDHIRTIMFLAISVDSIFVAISFKNLSVPFWETNIFSNKQLIFALFATTALLIASFTIAPLRHLLSLEPIHTVDYLVILFVGIFNIIVIETAKHFTFARNQ